MLEYNDFSNVIRILENGDPYVVAEKPVPTVWDSIHASINVASDKVRLRVVENESKADPFVSRYLKVFALAACFVLFAFFGFFALQSSVPGSSAELLAVGSYEGLGSASLQSDTLIVEVNDLQAPPDHSYEVWLLETDASGEVVDLQTLGNINSASEFEVPAGIDTSKFSVVDISLEPNDGDTAHSGQSILRGKLT